MTTEFKTIENISEGIFKDRGSKFLAYAFPVEKESEINKYRNDLKKKYYDARHHVYAFIIGGENQLSRASDDGEPANSSGPTVMGQIRSFGLTNTLIVVVRYFGGTKLGVPGLINAYRSASREALSNAKIITKKIEFEFKIEFNYLDINAVMRILKNDGVHILSQSFESSCSIYLKADKQIFNWLAESLAKVQSIVIHQIS